MKLIKSDDEWIAMLRGRGSMVLSPHKQCGKTYCQHIQLAVDVVSGNLKLEETLSVISPEKRETKPIREWLSDWELLKTVELLLNKYMS